MLPLPLALLAAIGIVVLPGFLVIPALVSRWGSKLRPGEFLLIGFGVSVCLNAWLALVLAEIGVFRLAWIGAAWFVCAALITAWTLREGLARDQFIAVARLTDRWDLALALIVVAAGVLYLRPGETILAGQDPAGYVLTGQAIAQDGRVLLRDPMVAELGSEERRALFGYVPVPWQRSGWPGFTMHDFTSGEIEPHGYHLYPAWLALWGSLLGIVSLVYGTPVLGTLSVAALGLLGRRIASPAVGVGAAGLFAINVAQIWYSRNPSAESIAQFLLLFGTLCLTLMEHHRSKTFGALAGAAFGLVHLAKIDLVALPVVVGLGFGTIWALRRWRSGYGAFLGAYLLLLGHSLCHAVLFAPAYTIGTALTVLPTLDSGPLDRANPDHPYGLETLLALAAVNGRVVAFILIAIVCVVAAIVATRLWTDRRGTPVFRVPRFPLWLVGSTIAIALYAYFVRPVIIDLPPSGNLALDELRQSDRESLVRLGWYLSPPGLALGLAGLVGLILRRPGIGLAVILAAASLEGTLFLWRGMVTPVHFWAIRRFVPLVVPILTLGAAFSLHILAARIASRFGPRTAVSTVALLGTTLAVLIGQPALPFIVHREYAGAIGQVVDQANQLPRESVFLFEWSALGGRTPAPVALLTGQTTFAVVEGTLADPGLRQAVGRWTAQGRSVYYLRLARDPLRGGPGLDLQPAGSWVIDVPEAESRWDRLPRQVNRLRIDYQMFTVRPLS